MKYDISSISKLETIENGKVHGAHVTANMGWHLRSVYKSHGLFLRQWEPRSTGYFRGNKYLCPRSLFRGGCCLCLHRLVHFFLTARGPQDCSSSSTSLSSDFCVTYKTVCDGVGSCVAVSVFVSDYLCQCSPFLFILEMPVRGATSCTLVFART